MFADFPQIVPQKICLSCQGCCRFKEAASVWRPKVAPEELAGQDNSVRQALSKDGYLKTVREKGQNCCTFLHLGSNKCGIYACRPFECRLYPFLLTRPEKNGRITVSVHLSCPYVQGSRYSTEFEKYVGVLKAYLSGEERLRFLKNNPALLSDYRESPQEIEELFTIGENL